MGGMARRYGGMAKIMNKLGYMAIFVREAGHALLCLSFILLVFEYLIPGFATLYLHPYLLFVISLVCIGLSGERKEIQKNYSYRFPIALTLFMMASIGIAIFFVPPFFAMVLGAWGMLIAISLLSYISLKKYD